MSGPQSGRFEPKSGPRPKLDRMCYRIRSTFGRCRAKCGRMWSWSGQTRPTLVDLGETFVKLGPNLVESKGQCWPTPGNRWSNSAEVGPCFLEFGRSRSTVVRNPEISYAIPNVGRMSPTLRHCWPDFHRTRSVTAPFRPNSTRVRQLLGGLDRTRLDSDETRPATHNEFATYNLVEPGPISIRCGRIRRKFGRCLPIANALGHGPAQLCGVASQLWSKSRQLRSNSGQICPVLVEVSNCRAKLDRIWAHVSRVRGSMPSQVQPIAGDFQSIPGKSWSSLAGLETSLVDPGPNWTMFVDFVLGRIRG